MLFATMWYQLHDNEMIKCILNLKPEVNTKMTNLEMKWVQIVTGCYLTDNSAVFDVLDANCEVKLF